MNRGIAMPSGFPARPTATAQPRVAAPARRANLPAYATVLAGMLFNAVLCAAGTKGIHVSLTMVAGTEVCIVALSLMLAWREALAPLFTPAVLLFLCVIALWLADPTNDPKIIVEMAIIGGFTCLGMSAPDPRLANRLVWGVALLVLAVGLWEMFALVSFEHTFDVIGYFVNKGALTADHINDTGTRLSENGLRPEGYGRQLFPGLLSLHRVGSVFLEPVSAGNFTVICVAWALARASPASAAALLILTALVIGVLADDRFAIVCSAGVAGMMLTGLWRSKLLQIALPLLMVAALLVIGVTSHMQVDNSIAGRLVGSGRLLAGWSIPEWFGFTAPYSTSMDTGYSYVFGNMGIIATVALWITAVLRPKPAAASRFFAAISIYLTLGMSTGYSSLSIKTAALLWFLYGTLLAADRVRQGRGALPLAPPSGP